jgi:hypothetical protein
MVRYGTIFISRRFVDPDLGMVRYPKIMNQSTVKIIPRLYGTGTIFISQRFVNPDLGMVR